MLSILAPILVFGLVIFVHELGHFLAAKALGVYAPRFSIGFGPALWRMRRGETEYVLALLPIGGYVRMASRLDGETAFLEGGSEEAAEAAAAGGDPNAMIPFGPKPVPENRWFESKSLPARLVIMVAGVTMNVVLSLVVCVSVAFHDGHQIVPITTVLTVAPVAKAPALSELHSMDTIRAVNGTPVHSWNDVVNGLSASTTAADIQTQRGTVHVPLSTEVTGATLANAIDFYVAPVLDSVVAGDPAANAGFLRGDSVVSINGTPIKSWSDLVGIIGASANQAVTVQVSRADGSHQLTVTPRPVPNPDSTPGKPATLGKIGAAPRVFRREPMGLADGFGTGFRMTERMAGMITGFLHQLFVGEVSLKQLGGPIAISKASVSAARGGLEELFLLIALLSVNVAILNLFPIPILDGGQILINVLESAKGSPFTLRTREYILRFGLVLIAMLFAVVMFNDTRGWFVQLFGWGAKLFG